MDDLSDLIKETFSYEFIYAHLKEDSTGSIVYETLLEHSLRSYETSLYILESLGFNSFFDNDDTILCAFNKILKKGLLFSVAFHDFGKQNYYFQRDKMNNDRAVINDFVNIEFKTISSNISEKISESKTSNHSRFNLLSYNELIFKEYLQDDIDNFLNIVDMSILIGRNPKKKEIGLFNEIVYLFKFLIESHHDGLKPSFNIDKLPTLNKLYPKLDLLLIIEIFHSILVNSDVISTKYFLEEDTNKVSIIDYCNNKFSNISNNKTLELLSSIENKQEYNKILFDDLIEMELFDFKLGFNNISNINELKSFFAKSIINNIRTTDISSNSFLFLEGAVGIGKTNISFLIANEFLKKDQSKNKIFYVAPLNYLLFQARDELLRNSNFGEENLNIINSIEREHNKNLSNAQDSYFYENFNKNFILTSSVNFFEKLFHKGKKDISHLIYLKDSIIFIDELQLLNDNFFDISYKYLELLTKYLNCQIIIMSATVPLKKYTKNITLKNNIKYILDKNKLDMINSHKCLNRNSYNLDFFDSYEDASKRKSLEYLLSKNENQSILIVHNSIAKLNEFKKIVESSIPDDYEVRFYHNNILKPINDETLRIVKEGIKKIIVFATRKIETGVDVSFSQGIKFIDSIDNIEQYSGRINRYGNYIDSELLIIADGDIYFSNQERERITKLYATNKNIVKQFIGNIDKYYYEVFEKNETDDVFIYNLSKSDIQSLNNLQLINEYIKENFIVDINFKENSDFFNLLPQRIQDNIIKYNILSSIDLFDKSNAFFYSPLSKEIQSMFLISGFVNRKSNFGKELSSLKEINISKSKKYIDMYKILDQDNFYYDLLTGIDFNKDIETEEILDTFNI